MLTKLIRYTTITLVTCFLATPLAATKSEKLADKASKTDAAAKSIHLNRKEILTHLKAIVKQLPYVAAPIAKKLQKAEEGETLSDDILTELVSNVLTLARPKPTDSQEVTEHYKALKTAEELLIKRLKSYRITGASLSVDPNGAFFVDNQDPAFTVAYCNAKGETKTRKYQASIDSIGLKIEFAYKLDLIFITGTDADFYSTNQVIELGTGIEFNGGLLLRFLMRRPPSYHLGEDFAAYMNRIEDFHYTQQEKLIMRFIGNISLLYVPFKNVSGGLLIIGLALGPCSLLGFPASCGSDLSIVYGGTLTPID